MQQIADWLEKLGMSEYAKAFADNGIDVSVLPHLTDQDLKDIGVLLGHRRKMLAAIAKLVGAVETPPQPAPTERKVRDTAERRQVTVLFSDLVGSTARFPPAWTLRTYVRSSLPIRRPSPRLCSGSAGS
jgi:hypothetical protein